jgi:hypothetical protein
MEIGMSSNEIRKFIKILNEAVETPSKFPCTIWSADGQMLFAVDGEETFGIMQELEEMGLNEADAWGGMEFNVNLSPEWQTRFAKIKAVNTDNANKAWAKYEAKAERLGMDPDDGELVEYAEKLFSILLKYAVEYGEDAGEWDVEGGGYDPDY